MAAPGETQDQTQPSGVGGDYATLRAKIQADVAAVRRFRGSRLLPYLFPNLFAVLTFRVAHALGVKGFGPLAHLISLAATALTGAEISWRAEIGPGLFLHHPPGVILPAELRAGKNLDVGIGVVLGSRSPQNSGFPTIGDGVSIMAKASVLGPVTVGSGAVVGAHALVVKNVPEGATALGVPARNYLRGNSSLDGAPSGVLSPRDTIHAGSSGRPATTRMPRS